VSIKAGKDAAVVEQILAVVRTQDSPILVVIDVIRLMTVDK
jgi:hypothetical protein